MSLQIEMCRSAAFGLNFLLQYWHSILSAILLGVVGLSFGGCSTGATSFNCSLVIASSYFILVAIYFARSILKASSLTGAILASSGPTKLFTSSSSKMLLFSYTS